MSTVREERLREEDLESLEEEWREELLLLEDLEEEDLEDDLDEDLESLEEDLEDPVGTSRMFNSRPVVGSVVKSTLGLWAMW